MNVATWIEEFKRRRVFRALVGYGLVAFALLQVVEPVTHGLALPEWTLKALVVGLGLGFPATILLAWAYDVRAGGIVRTDPAGGPARPGRGWRVLVMVGLGLLLAAPVVTYELVFRRAPAAVPAGGAGDKPGAPSVAVLPFVNMSDDAGNEYFSDGLSEEILNTLAQIPGLRVPARTSSFAFKGRSEDVGRIGAALRVATILEGSVRKSGGRVRVTAQLVNAADGYHLWSQTFDRELKDVFAIQDDIATAIAEALRVRLAQPADGARRPPGATASPEAHEAYLLGRHALNERTRRSIEASIVHFEKAVALDPDFALAYADMSVAVLLLGRSASGYGDVPMQEALARARPLLQKAQRLAGDRPEVLAAAGFLEQEAGQYLRALQFYDRSLALNPSSGEVRNWRTIALQELGRLDELLGAASDAVTADPLSKIALLNHLPVLQAFGRTEEIGPVVERLRGLDPAWGQLALGWVAMGRGDRVEAVRHLLPAMLQGRDRAARDLASVLASLGLREEALRVGSASPLEVYLDLGDHARALALARSAARQAPDDPDVLAALFISLYRSGRPAEAAEVAARLWEARPGGGHHSDLLVPMADAARKAGRPSEAARYVDRGRALAALAERAGLAPEKRNLNLALLAAYDGRDEEAVALLDAVLPTYPGSRADLELPIAAGLLRRADYRGLLERVEAMLTDQRAQVVRLLCGPGAVEPAWRPQPATCARRTAAR